MQNFHEAHICTVEEQTVYTFIIAKHYKDAWTQNVLVEWLTFYFLKTKHPNNVNASLATWY